ncbi:MAG: SAM-dependent methyltransferase [Paraglaciecola sp.]|jgi:SAM-dependent methyltransferase
MNAYDNLPYQSYAISITAPAYLEMQARLRGLIPPSFNTADVLEIGCGDGANLLPLAYYNPEANFLGIDASAAHIDQALTAQKELGLNNVEFLLMDISQYQTAKKFDYIIVHGVFSWVPEAVRDAILQFVKSNLSAKGLFYVSYNCTPGWSIRGLVRQQLFNADQQGSGSQDVEKGLTLCGELSALIKGNDSPYSVLLQQELERVGKFNPSYIAHEYLSDINQDFIFSAVAALAKDYELDYVGDANDFRPEGLVDYALYEQLNKTYPASQREDIIDLICFRQMRASVFCKNDSTFKRVDDDFEFEAFNLIGRFDFAPHWQSNLYGEMQFKNDGGLVFTIRNPLVKIALVMISQAWPNGYKLNSFNRKNIESSLSLDIDSIDDLIHENRQELVEAIRLLHWHGLLELALNNPIAPSVIPDYPLLNRLSAFEIRHKSAITSGTHKIIWLSPLQRAVLQLLDGKSTKQEIAGLVLAQAINTDEAQNNLEQFIDKTLQLLATWDLFAR